jgi:hypothetical protein
MHKYFCNFHSDAIRAGVKYDQRQVTTCHDDRTRNTGLHYQSQLPHPWADWVLETWQHRKHVCCCWLLALNNSLRHTIRNLIVKVTEPRNRPGVAQRVPGGLGSQISWHSAHEAGKVVSLTHRPPLLPGNAPGNHFHYGLIQPQGHGAVGRNMSLKNTMTPPGIDPGTVHYKEST